MWYDGGDYGEVLLFGYHVTYLFLQKTEYIFSIKFGIKKYRYL